MMKKNIVLVMLLICVGITAQQTLKVTIDWQEVSLHSNDGTVTIPGFNNEYLEFSETNGLRYVRKWIDPYEGSGSLKVSNVRYQNISRTELKNLDFNLVRNDVSISVKSTSARNKDFLFLDFHPIIKEGNQFKKVISFDVLIEKGFKKSVLKPKNLNVTSSVLATGEWFRFTVDKTGIFRITPSFLSNLGIDLSSVNPATIKIYGNGGRMLPLLNQDNSEFDLRENAIQVIGGDDGNFGGNDYILFYGESTEGFTEESLTNLNLYDTNSYYYITYGGSNGKRVTNYIEPTAPTDVQINTFTDYQFYEVDTYNLIKAGRRWFGDRFDIQNTRNYNFSFPNLVQDTPLVLSVYAAAISGSSSNMSVFVNNVDEGELNFSRVLGTNYGSARQLIKDINSSSSDVNVRLVYDNEGNPSAEAYLDFISIKGQRQLINSSGQMAFFNEEVASLSGVGEYTVSNASAVLQIWDVTSPSSITSLSNTNGASDIVFKADLGEIRKYHTVVDDDYFTPSENGGGRIMNQDIKGSVFLDEQGQFEDVDYLIIANNDFIGSANRLAEHHRNFNGFNVKVVTLNEIYQEFSSGKQDIVAIRNLVRYIYENASEESKKLKYLCLLGDGSIDYRELLTDGNCVNTNIVPTFQNLESFNSITSFASDDFFGLMDPTEGLMTSGDQLDIAVGRILADTPQLADALVTKIISYDELASYGSWRNSVLMVADDVDEEWESGIQENLDLLSDALVARKPSVNLIKVYADSYQQEATSSGTRYPKVNEDFINGMEEGAIVVDYFGHGGEDGLSTEFFFSKSDAQNLQNENRYPLFITVTCEFTKFDNPCRETAGELTFKNPKGGAVALISTTRSVRMSTGIDINDRLAEILFPENGEAPTVGETVRLMKNSFTSSERRVVFFFGDPAMKIASPKPDIRLTHINDVAITGDTDPLKALSKVKLSGEVINASGNIISDYNGVLSTVIFDKEIERSTLGNDSPVIFDFKTLGSVIFRGKASVESGKFEFEFVVPKDINISEGKGRISFYAKKDGELDDQAGADQNVLIGGLNENAPEDNQGPQIQLFMNDESFISGDVTDNSPVLIGKFSDENGINTSSGIGHDISAILDGDESNPFVLNNFYETELNDFTKGSVNFKLRDLEPGLHTLTVKVWDVYNNSSSQEIEFVVADDGGFRLDNVLNYPNPFVSYTEFWFDHSSVASDLLEVQVQVFTVSGKVVWTQNQTLTGNTSYKSQIQWDGNDDFGDKLGKGVYVYKISVKSTLTNQQVEKFEKLVVL